jgi:hypothetical protein
MDNSISAIDIVALLAHSLCLQRANRQLLQALNPNQWLARALLRNPATHRRKLVVFGRWRSAGELSFTDHAITCFRVIDGGNHRRISMKF